MANEQTSNVIQLFLIQNTTVNLLNAGFQNYTNGWTSMNEGGTTTSAAIYPCLTGGTDLQTINNFIDWAWKNGRMYHSKPVDDPINDAIYQQLDDVMLGHTYKVSFDI